MGWSGNSEARINADTPRFVNCIIEVLHDYRPQRRVRLCLSS